MTMTKCSSDTDMYAWKDKDTYGRVVERRFLQPLEDAVKRFGHVPCELQLSVLGQLQWYFATDARERAPTVVVDKELAAEFHERVNRVMGYISVDAIGGLEETGVEPEVMHALFSYKAIDAYSGAVADRFDEEQGLLRLTYFQHGHKPAETFEVDGVGVTPAYEKYRGCRFFSRMLLRQRIVWIPVADGTGVALRLDGRPVPIALGRPCFLLPHSSDTDVLPLRIAQAKRELVPGAVDVPRLPLSLGGLRARLIRWLAQLPFVRKRFRDAWVFIDRDTDADDSAEHLYRWVRDVHPEVNAWFLLQRSAADWPRLREDGFKMVRTGLMASLACLNARNVISSHAEYYDGRLSRLYYGDLMRWRRVFVEHGISKDNVSNWFNNIPFDLFVTTSPAEYDSFVSDDTPYKYTNKEVRLLGLPRHDRLLSLAESLRDSAEQWVVVMPTWRSSLVSRQPDAGAGRDVGSHPYFKAWRSFLNSDRLSQMAKKSGKRIMFIPHPNAQQLVTHFAVPANITIKTASMGFQSIVASAAALVTDYTSVAFEFALLRRPTFYFQFDQEAFYGGDHNWRPGYFDYKEHGFGPVCRELGQLLDALDAWLSSGRFDVDYQGRMRSAMPIADGGCCERAYEAIERLRAPYSGTASATMPTKDPHRRD